MRHSDIYKRIYPKAGETAKTENPNLQEKAENLRGKLGKYAMASAALVAVSSTAEATIKYTDANDTVLTAPGAAGYVSYPIDFDKDGAVDLYVSAIKFGGGGSGIGIYRQGSNLILGNDSTFQLAPGTTYRTNLPYALAKDAQISAGGNFASFPGGYVSTASRLNGNDTFGNWIPAPVNNSYIGVQFATPGGTRYGWVQLSVTTQGQVTIHDYAYEDSGKAIKAGDKLSIPTLSEWGLITLAIFLLSFGTLYIGRREEILAAQSSSGGQFKMGHFWQKPPFEWAVFWKTLLATAGLAGVAGGLSLFAYGTIAAADLIGTAIAGPLFAYLMHLLWIFERDSKE